ncbi:MAG: TRAP transporter large permease [Alphaproteobacteria bacterium]|nr:TRAP transporter large permease [Alphaproteobacteria bacterium]
MSAALFLMLGAFFLAAAIRVPIGYAMIGSGVLYLAMTGKDVGLAGEQILQGLYTNFVFLAVPLFIFAANVMNVTTVTDRLFDFCLVLVGRLRGGLAHVNVLTSLVFSGMSGSAVADAAGIGKLTIDMMVKDNRYTRGFAAAITAASAVIGPIFPPSIPMVLYAMVSNTSVGYLFLGGMVPGVLMAVLQMVGIAAIAKRRNFPIEAKIPIREFPLITGRAFPALMMPVVMLGGIYSGAFTPTEAAAVASVYAIMLALFYRTLSLGRFVTVLVETARSSSVVALIIAGAFVFNYIIAGERTADHLAAWLTSMELSQWQFLLLVNIVFLILGCFLDATVMLLVLVPLLLPTVKALGIDLVHFGVVIVVNMMIGLVTPPYGVLLFVISGLTGIKLREIIREGWLWVWLMVAQLVAMTYIPGIVLWVPWMLGYDGK